MKKVLFFLICVFVITNVYSQKGPLTIGNGVLYPAGEIPEITTHKTIIKSEKKINANTYHPCDSGLLFDLKTNSINEQHFNNIKKLIDTSALDILGYELIPFSFDNLMMYGKQKNISNILEVNDGHITSFITTTEPAKKTNASNKKVHVIFFLESTMTKKTTYHFYRYE